MEEVLRVHNWKDRVVVDLEEDNHLTDHFIALSPEGMTLHMGLEKTALSWAAAEQLIEAIKTGMKVFRPKT